MDNSSYQEARLQLIKMFNKPSDFRHIIFWYDPNGDFLDDIKADSFDEAKIKAIEDANSLANPNAIAIGQKLIIPMN